MPILKKIERTYAYPEEIERTKGLLGLQLYEAINTMEDVQEEDAMYEGWIFCWGGSHSSSPGSYIRVRTQLYEGEL